MYQESPYSDLQSYFEHHNTYEMTQWYLKSLALLDDLGRHQVHEAVTQIIYLQETQEPQTNQSEIYGLFIQALKEVIAQLGITLQDKDHPLKTLYYILYGIEQAEHYGDPYSLLIQLGKEQTPDDHLCDVLDLLTPLTWFDFKETIESVNETLVVRLNQLLETRYVDLPSVQSIDYIRSRCQRFEQTTQSSLIQDFLHDGIRLGHDIVYLVEKYESVLEGHQKDPQSLALWVMALVLISHTQHTELVKTLEELVEMYAADIHLQVKTMDAIRALSQQTFSG